MNAIMEYNDLYYCVIPNIEMKSQAACFNCGYFDSGKCFQNLIREVG